MPRAFPLFFLLFALVLGGENLVPGDIAQIKAIKTELSNEVRTSFISEDVLASLVVDVGASLLTMHSDISIKACWSFLTWVISLSRLYVDSEPSYTISPQGWLIVTDTTKRLMSSPKCRSVEVINNPARPGLNHREVNCINYK